jgi:hypothetical protein
LLAEISAWPDRDLHPMIAAWQSVWEACYGQRQRSGRLTRRTGDRASGRALGPSDRAIRDLGPICDLQVAGGSGRLRHPSLGSTRTHVVAPTSRVRGKDLLKPDAGLLTARKLGFAAPGDTR